MVWREIRFCFWIAAPFPFHERQRVLEVPLVHIDDVGDADVGNGRKVFVVILPAAASATSLESTSEETCWRFMRVWVVLTS